MLSIKIFPQFKRTRISGFYKINLIPHLILHITIFFYSSTVCLAQVDNNNIGLKAHYAFEGNADDSSGNGNHGTVNGGAAWTATGKIGGSLDFDAVDDYVGVGDIDLTDAFTIAVWIKLSTTGKYMIVSKSYQTYQFFVNRKGKLVFQRNSSTAIRYNAGLVTDTWYHVAVTFNTTDGMVMYLNGNAVATNGDTTPTNTNNDATKIGATGMTAKRFFHGIIDEVRIYDKALSVTVVDDLYNNPPVLDTIPDTTPENINRAPVLDTIKNIVVNEGVTIAFNPTASDADGDNLTFSYSGWITSNSYTTNYTDAGNHTLTVTVSDGTLTDSQVVNIYIINTDVSQITVLWDANTEPGLAGYRVYCGTSSKNYDTVIDVSTQTSHVLSNLISNETYYIAVTALSISGDESIYSDEVFYNVPIY